MLSGKGNTHVAGGGEAGFGGAEGRFLFFSWL
jgi:hypothetical protein